MAKGIETRENELKAGFNPAQYFTFTRIMYTYLDMHAVDDMPKDTTCGLLLCDTYKPGDPVCKAEKEPTLPSEQPEFESSKSISSMSSKPEPEQPKPEPEQPPKYDLGPLTCDHNNFDEGTA